MSRDICIDSVFFSREWEKKKKTSKRKESLDNNRWKKRDFLKNNSRNAKTVGKVVHFRETAEGTFLLWNMICHYIKRAFGWLEAARSGKNYCLTPKNRIIPERKIYTLWILLFKLSNSSTPLLNLNIIIYKLNLLIKAEHLANIYNITEGKWRSTKFLGLDWIHADLTDPSSINIASPHKIQFPSRATAKSQPNCFPRLATPLRIQPSFENGNVPGGREIENWRFEGRKKRRGKSSFVEEIERKDIKNSSLIKKPVLSWRCKKLHLWKWTSWLARTRNGWKFYTTRVHNFTRI